MNYNKCPLPSVGASSHSRAELVKYGRLLLHDTHLSLYSFGSDSTSRYITNNYCESYPNAVNFFTCSLSSSSTCSGGINYAATVYCCKCMYIKGVSKPKFHDLILNCVKLHYIFNLKAQRYETVKLPYCLWHLCMGILELNKLFCEHFWQDWYYPVLNVS